MTAGDGGPARHGGAEPPAWATAATLAAILAVCYVLRYALLPVAVVAALAFVLRPVVRWLQRRLRVPRIVGVVIVYLAVLAVVGVAAWSVVGVAGDRIVEAASDAPTLLAERIRGIVGPHLHAFGRDITPDEIAGRIVGALGAVVASPQGAVLAGGAVVGVPTIGVLMLVILFYFLDSGRQLLQGLLHLFPPRYRGHIAYLGARIEPMLRHYVRGVVAVTLYTALVSWLVLGVGFHVGFAVPISVAVGVLELIPVVGPAASIALFGAAAMIDGHGLWTFASFMALAVFLRISVDNVVGPLVLGRAVTLHPVVIIIAFLIGASLFGVIGVFVAVPVAAAVRIVLGIWYEDEAARLKGRGPEGPAPAAAARGVEPVPDPAVTPT